MTWEKTYQQKVVSADTALDAIKDGDSVFLGVVCGVPYLLNKLFWQRAKQWNDIKIIEALSLQPMPLDDPGYRGHVQVYPFFVGPFERKGIKSRSGIVSHPPMHFSAVNTWLTQSAKPRVALLHVSLPDERGYMSLGAMGICTGKAVLETAEVVVVEVNKQYPYVYGQDNLIHVDDVDFIVEQDSPVPELPNPPVSDQDRKIASYIIDEIPDGATIQIGIGGIANAVTYGLECRKDLGVHTEMLTDAMVYLTKKGIINCKRKNYFPGKIVSSQFPGSREMYDFIHRNPLIHGCTYDESNRPELIAKNDNMIGIMGTLAVDLTGQAASEALGFDQYSSTGGQADFMRGCSRSKGGKSFLALHSTVKNKDGSLESRIVLSHLPGAAITTHRSDIHHVVTEYGIVNLRGQSMSKRAELLISIAHPSLREQLTADAKKVGLII